jgi:hypothetical protein
MLMVKQLTLMNKELEKFCLDRLDIVGIVKQMLPRGLRPSLRSIVVRRSEFTLTNYATIVMCLNDGDSNLYCAREFQVPCIMDDVCSLRFYCRVVVEMYYVIKG